MKSNFSLSIPKPCSEDWNSFTPTSTGGFCGSCQKNVIDFTKATDDEIIAFISRKPEHACGRFTSDQLKTYAILPEVKIRPGFMLLKAGAISLLLLFMNKQTSAQTAQAKPATELGRQVITHDEKQIENYETIIRGVVTSEDSSALPGVSVVQRNTSNGTQTDDEGRFELRMDPSNGNVLVFSFISLETQEYTLTTGSQRIKIIMKPDLSTLDEVVVVAGGLSIERRELSGSNVYCGKESGLKKFWRKIKTWF